MRRTSHGTGNRVHHPYHLLDWTGKQMIMQRWGCEAPGENDSERASESGSESTRVVVRGTVKVAVRGQGW